MVLDLKQSFCAALAVLFLFWGPVRAEEPGLGLTGAEKKWLQDHPVVRVAGPKAFPPIHFYDKDGKAMGVSADYVRLISLMLGVRVEYIPNIPWSEVLSLAKNGEIDWISCAARTTQRDQYLLFSDPYLSFPLVIIGRQNGPFIGGVKDLAGKRVACVNKISTCEDLAEEGIDFIPVYAESPKAGLVLVSQGKADASIENLVAASYLINREGLANLQISAPTSYENYELHFAVPKENALFLSALNKALSAISYQGHAEIRDKWLSIRFEHGIRFVDVLKWGMLAFLFGGSLISLFLFWNRRLRKEVDRRQKAQLALSERERLYRLLFDQSPLGVLHVDPHGFILDCNQAVMDLMEAPRDRIVGVNMLKDRNNDAVKAALVKALEDEDGYFEGKYFSQITNKDLLVRIHLKRLENERGKVAGLIVLVEDIAERILAEVALKISEDRFRKAFDFANDGICIISPELDIARVNKRMCSILGYSKEELEGKNIQDLSHPDDLAVSPALKKRYEKGEVENAEFEKRYLHKEGRTVWGHISNSVVRDQEGNPEYYVSHMRDITDQKRWEQTRKEMERQLRYAHKVEAIGTLTGGIAHDFNNILAILMGNLELVASDLDEGNPAQSYVEEAKKACKRARDLVSQLLAFSKKGRQKKEPLEVRSVLVEALGFLRASTPTTIEIHQTITDQPCVIWGDSTQLYQVLVNLCTNALQAMEENGGLMSVSLSRFVLEESKILGNAGLQPGEYAEIKVADTGPGIPPDYLDRIFDPYFTTKEVGRGSGMGLAMVQGIVSSHMGAVWVHNPPETGACFHVLLPLVDENPVKAPKALPSARGRGETILVVDDEPGLLTVLSQMLTRLDYNVKTAQNGAEALAIVEKAPDKIDLVLTDMTMPVMTGAELAEKLFDLRPNLPIILATGFSEKVNREKALEMGFSDYISKPPTQGSLAHSIRAALDQAAS